MDRTPTFKFIEFNPRRAQRGKEAARVEVNYGDGMSEWLWMNADDIMENLETFGDSTELQKALAAYGSTPITAH
jgi:hypothetical protein